MTRGEAFDKLQERFPGKVVEPFIGEAVKKAGLNMNMLFM